MDTAVVARMGVTTRAAQASSRLIRRHVATSLGHAQSAAASTTAPRASATRIHSRAGMASISPAIATSSNPILPSRASGLADAPAPGFRAFPRASSEGRRSRRRRGFRGSSGPLKSPMKRP